jgi:hypothetical protein
MEAANVAAPTATMGPRVSPAMQALRQERELYDIAFKKRADLAAQLADAKERLAAYRRLDPKNKKKEVLDRLEASIERRVERRREKRTKDSIHPFDGSN